MDCFCHRNDSYDHRYWGKNLSDLLTASRAANPGCNLSIKLRQYLRPKCHAIFYDTVINSPLTARLNVYQAFLLCAMKFHAHVKVLSAGTENNPAFFFKVIRCASRYMAFLIQARVTAMRKPEGPGCRGFIAKREVEWLALHAFSKILRRKQARHKKLLVMLERARDSAHYRRIASAMVDVVDIKRSSIFKCVRY
ncbi:hypothetical protein CBR_g45710 [Chara braunii]|uniref:Telomerase reverse transcriptase n=1 Tax=Chara braunii TaxID=69332 RepID=A0A388K3P1_CHABU|nr:hypothetical protein CBR_g45710 [Chara braunii]|eukprot:GBG64655.1 hypothetical protein CBR_g45710 [Chara braunii]